MKKPNENNFLSLDYSQVELRVIAAMTGKGKSRLFPDLSKKELDTENNIVYTRTKEAKQIINDLIQKGECSHEYLRSIRKRV